MSLLTNILVALSLISAFITISSEYYIPEKYKYFFKPLATICILFIALSANTDNFHYKYLIVAGLFFSIFGDIFMLFPKDKITQGLISFLIAHIFYVIAFNPTTKIDISVYSLYVIIPFLLYGAITYSTLFKYLNEMKIPVFIYIMIILLMCYQAFTKWTIFNDLSSLSALCGAFLFLASDTILAFDIFRKKFKLAEFLYLSTYFIAQLLIALSIIY